MGTGTVVNKDQLSLSMKPCPWTFIMFTEASSERIFLILDRCTSIVRAVKWSVLPQTWLRMVFRETNWVLCLHSIKGLKLELFAAGHWKV